MKRCNPVICDFKLGAKTPRSLQKDHSEEISNKLMVVNPHNGLLIHWIACFINPYCTCPIVQYTNND